MKRLDEFNILSALVCVYAQADKTIMDDEIGNPGAGIPEEGGEGEEKELDPDMIEDTFDDVDNL